MSDETGVPYVFYLKQGRHTIRMEAVPGERADLTGGVRDGIDWNRPDTAASQPLAIDYIDIVPADTERVCGSKSFLTGLEHWFKRLRKIR